MGAPPRSRWAPSGSARQRLRRGVTPRSASSGTSRETGIRYGVNQSSMRFGSPCGCCGPAVATEGSSPQSAPGAPTRRLFFALWPDEAMREAMVQAIREPVRASGGRPVHAGNLHVTLAFLGAVPERRLTELAEAARAAAEDMGSDPAA